MADRYRKGEVTGIIHTWAGGQEMVILRPDKNTGFVLFLSVTTSHVEVDGRWLCNLQLLQALQGRDKWQHLQCLHQDMFFPVGVDTSPAAGSDLATGTRRVANPPFVLAAPSASGAVVPSTVHHRLHLVKSAAYGTVPHWCAYHAAIPPSIVDAEVTTFSWCGCTGAR